MHCKNYGYINKCLRSGEPVRMEDGGGGRVKRVIQRFWKERRGSSHCLGVDQHDCRI